jgi:hypothetical protein
VGGTNRDRFLNWKCDRSNLLISCGKTCCVLLLLRLWACGQRSCVVHHVHSLGADNYDGEDAWQWWLRNADEKVKHDRARARAASSGTVERIKVQAASMKMRGGSIKVIEDDIGDVKRILNHPTMRAYLSGRLGRPVKELKF